MLIEMNIDFAIHDPDGNEVGRIRQEGQSKMKKLARFVSSLDQFMTHTLAVYDVEGAKVIELTRPAKFVKSRVLVKDGSGSEVGRIVQQNVIGKIRFGFEDAKGQPLGLLNAENWRAWNFSIQDTSGKEVARITKTWEGLAKTPVHHRRQLPSRGERTRICPEPMRQLILASAAGARPGVEGRISAASANRSGRAVQRADQRQHAGSPISWADTSTSIVRSRPSIRSDRGSWNHYGLPEDWASEPHPRGGERGANMPAPSDEHLSRLRMVQLFESLSDEDLAELTRSGKFMHSSPRGPT